MEAHGTAAFITHIYKNFNVFVRELVPNDNSSIRKFCRQSYKELIKIFLMKEEDHPRTSSNNKVADNGQLPLDHFKIRFFADRAHRIRGFCSKHFALYSKKQEIFIETSHDAERIKKISNMHQN